MLEDLHPPGAVGILVRVPLMGLDVVIFPVADNFADRSQPTRILVRSIELDL